VTPALRQLIAILDGGSLGIVSPHLDDAILSVGGIISELTATARVDIITVLAYDPSRTGAPTSWDAAAGFKSASDACAARRREDSAACQVVGARPIWLPFTGPLPRAGSSGHSDLREAVQASLAPYVAVLIPAFPLYHPDHEAIARLVEDTLSGDTQLGTYAEEPYRASPNRLRRRKLRLPDRTLLGRRLHWYRSPLGPTSRRAKAEAASQYESQVGPVGLGGMWRQRLFERLARGELIGIAE
jgi:LmbE family N-acetylglucosaminyl deacetylase